MKPALGFRQPHSPDSWQRFTGGDVLLSAINAELTDWWPKFFGYHLLKIGSLSAQIDTSLCPINHQVSVFEDKAQAGVVAEIDDLPFLEHSVDVCLLSHALEFTIDPHHVVREANRVLIPNGYLVITGFNPFSLAGLNKFVPYRRHKFPWNERFFSPSRIKDWLDLMGFEVLADQRTIFSTMDNKVSAPIVSFYWQKLAKQFLSNFGSVYVIVAKKRRYPLTPIKPKWQLRASLKPANVPSMKASNKTRYKAGQQSVDSNQ